MIAILEILEYFSSVVNFKLLSNLIFLFVSLELILTVKS